MALFTGCGVAIATPFKADGSVDFEAYRNLINWQIEQGIDAIITCGTSGEASTLDDDEHVETIRFWLPVLTVCCSLLRTTTSVHSRV